MGKSLLFAALGAGLGLIADNMSAKETVQDTTKEVLKESDKRYATKAYVDMQCTKVAQEAKAYTDSSISNWLREKN